MFNILSTEEKKKILTEYRLRLAVAVVFAVAILFLANLILLVPSYLITTSKYNDATNVLAELEGKPGTVVQEKNINAQISSVNKNINLFLSENTSSKLSPTSVISSILSIKGPSIKIYGFTYDTAPKQDKMVISGVSLDRESLALFVENLKKDPTFVSVDLPISSYVKSTNLDFSIVITRDRSQASKQ